jgi:hypothetical protein
LRPTKGSNKTITLGGTLNAARYEYQLIERPQAARLRRYQFVIRHEGIFSIQKEGWMAKGLLSGDCRSSAVHCALNAVSRSARTSARVPVPPSRDDKTTRMRFCNVR